MKSKKIENVDMSGDLAQVTQNMMANAAPTGIVLNKELLPSKGMFYNSEIRVKKLSPIDAKNLSMITEDNATNVINSVIAKNIEGINPDDILIGDKLWLIFYIRSITYKDIPMKIKYTCPECKNVDFFNFQLKDLGVNYIKEDFDNQITLENGDIITVRFPTMGIERKASQIKKNDQFSMDPECLDISCYIQAINGTEVTMRRAYEYLTSEMDAYDFSIFATSMGKFAFGVNPYFDIECPCGNTIKQRVTFTEDFFMPNIKRD